MATWVVYHDTSNPCDPELAVKEVPEKVGEMDVRSALDASQKGCSVVPGADLMAFRHGVCLLGNAPKHVQEAYKAGKIETIKWSELWTPIT